MRFSTLLVANRGEIARRVIRTARRMGLRTVAVHSDADADSLHVRDADLAVRIGPPEAAGSYRNVAAILEACRKTAAGAVHPGYGFLSEDAGFARAVTDAGRVFVGPRPEVVALMGNKARAKHAMREAGVPTVPGVQGIDDPDALLAAASRIGFPVMLKAAAGGGGRGMRIARDAEQFARLLPVARSEALGAFGSGELIVERAIESARHVEIQVLCDEHGHCLHLGERDCSVQRRHQKIVEEAPSPAVTPALRAEMGRIAVQACQAIGYTGVGTLEFLLAPDGRFHFMEMNTRLQVEHAVTEMLTGIDLVEQQLRVAQGERLAIAQADVRLDGHAMELRVCAEDPARGFVPQVGRIGQWRAPPGVRVDTALDDGLEVTPHYDSMLAKFVAHGASRIECIVKLAAACERTALLGVGTNLAFLARCIRHPAFVAGEATTAFLAEQDLAGPEWCGSPSGHARAVALLVLAGTVPPDVPGGTGHGALVPGTEVLLRAGSAADGADGEPVHVSVTRGGEVVIGSPHGPGRDVVVRRVRFDATAATLTIDDVTRRLPFHCPGPDAVWVQDGADAWCFERARPALGGAAAASGTATVRAPMSGKVVSVSVRDGSPASADQVVVVLESMKMELTIAAGASGTVSRVHVAAGEQVSTGAVLLEIER